MLEQTVPILSNEHDTDLYSRLVLHAPQIAPLVQPGQFAHVRILPLKEALRNETRITRAMDKTEVIERMRRIVADYDAGKDAFEVYGFSELRP